MSQRLMCDVDMVEEQQLRQLEGDAAGLQTWCLPSTQHTDSKKRVQLLRAGGWTIAFTMVDAWLGCAGPNLVGGCRSSPCMMYLDTGEQEGAWV